MADDFNLYEFPQGHSGRKTYVSVRGHRRSVPSVYTYKGTDGRNYVLPEFGGDWSGYENYSTSVSAPMFIKDIGEYVSTLDGSHITSRSQHRDHMRRHGVIEVGNERMPKVADSGIARTRETMQKIKTHLEQVKAMPQSEYDNRVAKMNQDTSGVSV